MATLLSILHALQASFSAYTLYLSSISIRNLQKYEETSKKAAKYSNIAEQQLYKTRTTQASGVISVPPYFLPKPVSLTVSQVFFSFLCSTTLALYPVFSGRVRLVGAVLVAAGNIVVLEMARQHVGAFWKGKAKVPLPGVGEYNDAISKTLEVKMNMAYLVASWTAMGLLSLVL
jgi:hypothetical protein